MKNNKAVIYKPNPDAYRSTYGYGNMENDWNLYVAIALTVSLGLILATAIGYIKL